MNQFIKWISLTVILSNTNRSMSLQPMPSKPEDWKKPEARKPNYEIVRMLQYGPTPYPPVTMDIPMSQFPPRRILDYYDLPYQQPELPSLQFDIRFMPPPVYRIELPQRQFYPPPQKMLETYPFIVIPLLTRTELLTTNSSINMDHNSRTDNDHNEPTARISELPKTNSTTLIVVNSTRRPAQIVPHKAVMKDAQIRRLGFRAFSSMTASLEDRETNIIDTLKHSETAGYFLDTRPQKNPNSISVTTSHTLTTEIEELIKKREGIKRIVPVRKKLRQIRKS